MPIKVLMQNVYDMGYEAFEKLPQLRKSLAYCVADRLANRGEKRLLCDFSLGDIEFSAIDILAKSLAFAEVIKTLKTASGRIGIAIAPSHMAAEINYACCFANLTPVNLNFTLGEVAAKSCFETGKIDTVITAEIFKAKIVKVNPRFPWPKNTLDISEIEARVPNGRVKQLRAKIKDDFDGLMREFSISEFDDNSKEATLVFTSGSEGNPKAAVLSRRNILANCLQINISELFQKDDVFMANLPIFHSFGMLFEIWYMALYGQYTVTLFNPLDIKGNIRAVRIKGVTIMIGSPTFYRPYLRYASADDMTTVRAAISGAEKTPIGFEELWNERFGNSFREGYGLTEASPVVAVNLPMRNAEYFSTGNKKGSVGKLFPGMQAKILDVETREPLEFGKRGLLALRGANVFAEYLDNPDATKKALDGDWLVTGDLSRIDAEGFLFIEGRLSRFSKIGGEMVPHATVEAALVKEFGYDDSDIPVLAVSSRIDEGKGEALVLLSAVDIALADVKNALRKAGLSNLWHPKAVVRVEKIPVLSTGKLDLRALSKIAKDAEV